jgi:hypothetical protein
MAMVVVAVVAEVPASDATAAYDRTRAKSATEMAATESATYAAATESTT